METSLKIEVVKNGYIVMAGWDPNSGYSARGNEFVFESFAALAQWMETNLKNPKAPEQAHHQ